MFWKKKNDDLVWSKLVKLLDLINVDITKLKKEVEMINGKLRAKIYSKDEDDSIRGETHEQKGNNGIDDGFNELRDIRKNL